MTVACDHTPSARGMGQPGFPTPPAPQGDGATRLPHPPTRWEGLGGRSPPKNNLIFIAALCGASRMDG